MAFISRKFLNGSYGGSEEPPSDDPCKKFCDDDGKKIICPPMCSYFCKSCSQELSPETATDNSPPPPPPLVKHSHISTILTISLSVLAIFVFFFICYTIYKLYFMWYTSRSRRLGQRQGVEDDEEDEERAVRPVHSFHDEDQGPTTAVDHHIWYIRTIGLQPSVISAITVVKFKKGEGLIEGTDCSVCLSEFQENETLRLLPKCNHAFHIPCIDTWLGSHTNCPLCRAPITVNNTTITPIFNMEEPIMEENHDQVMGTRTSREVESRIEESNDDQIGFTKSVYRSVSFDSFSAPMAIEDEGKESSNENKFGMNQTSPSNQRSSSSSSSSTSSSMKRSFSCSAKV